MQLGLSSYAFPWAIGVPGYPPPEPMTVFAFVRRASALGVKVVQIADNLPLHTLSPAAEADLWVLLQDIALQVEVGTRGSQPAHLLRYLALAERFGSPLVRVVIDTPTDQPPIADIIRRLRAVLPAYAARGITLAIENHDRLSAATLATILTACDSTHIGICLDTANSLGAGEGLDDVLRHLAASVVNLHVKDVRVRRQPHGLGFAVEGTPAGMGLIDLPSLLLRFSPLSDMNALLELWPPPEATVAATITKEAAWVEQSLAYLAGLPGCWAQAIERRGA